LSAQVITLPPESSRPPERVMVLLHGWGSNADDLAGLAPLFQLPNYTFICPQAPHPHPYAPNGWMWYDLQFESGVSGLQAKAGLAESRQWLGDWLSTLPQTTGVPLEQTVLAGFSQGGAMTLDLGLTLPLAALMVYSGYLHNSPEHPKYTPPILLIHGQQDAVVPIAAAQRARNQLTQAGLRITYQEFPMGHEIRTEVINLSRDFLNNLYQEN
jgi:phospholipase/carboxylesterase